MAGVNIQCIDGSIVFPETLIHVSNALSAFVEDPANTEFKLSTSCATVEYVIEFMTFVSSVDPSSSVRASFARDYFGVTMFDRTVDILNAAAELGIPFLLESAASAAASALRSKTPIVPSL